MGKRPKQRLGQRPTISASARTRSHRVSHHLRGLARRIGRHHVDSRGFRLSVGCLTIRHHRDDPRWAAVAGASISPFVWLAGEGRPARGAARARFPISSRVARSSARAIARAIALEAEAPGADEPTSALTSRWLGGDPQAARRPATPARHQLPVRLPRSRVVRLLADRVVVMYLGRSSRRAGGPGVRQPRPSLQTRACSPRSRSPNGEPMGGRAPPHRRAAQPDRSVRDGCGRFFGRCPDGFERCEREMPVLRQRRGRPLGRLATCMAEPGRVPGIGPLLAAYADGSRTPAGVLREALRDPRAPWQRPRMDPRPAARGRAPASLRGGGPAARAAPRCPLFACRSRSRTTSTWPAIRPPRGARLPYKPEATATVVRRLQEAGAILVGKTNLDQFATGLTGTRSPVRRALLGVRSDYVAGGSSSGSAVAVAARLVAFALAPTPRAPDACRRPSTASWGSSPRVGSSARRA